MQESAAYSQTRFDIIGESAIWYVEHLQQLNWFFKKKDRLALLRQCRQKYSTAQYNVFRDRA